MSDIVLRAGDLKPHPAADLFPMMSTVELASLAADIKRGGLLHPIVLLEDEGQRLIVDGRNRFAACAIAGVEPRFIRFEGDPFALVISANLERRHLGTGARADIACSMANLKHGINKNGDSTPRNHGDASIELAQKDAAKLLSVSRGSIQRMRVVRERGVPELVAAVVEGKVKLHAARAWVNKPREQQLAILTGGSPPPPPAVPVRNGRGRPSHDENRELIRKLTEQHFTTTDIVQQTGMKPGFVRDAKRRFRPPKNILANATQDAEVFAEFWASRSSRFDPRWLTATTDEKKALIRALRACCREANRMVRRLNKEADEVSDETYQADSV